MEQQCKTETAADEAIEISELLEEMEIVLKDGSEVTFSRNGQSLELHFENGQSFLLRLEAC